MNMPRSWKSKKADKLEIGAEYQALVDDIDLKKTQLYIKVGTFSGLISKKNMSWAVGRKRLNNIFAKGDVIPVAALSKDEKAANTNLN
jgi:ribosomal protein S1